MSCALRVSEAAALAMHACGLLGLEPEQPLSTRGIAGCFNVSEAHLSKVLQRLVKVGLVRSIRGPKGGFLLAREPEKITLMDVFVAIEGPFDVTGCSMNVPLCDGTTCILGRVLVEANQKLLAHLSSTDLKSISRVLLDGRIPLPAELQSRSPATS